MKRIFLILALVFATAAQAQFLPSDIDSMFVWISASRGLPAVGPGDGELRTYRHFGETGFSGDQWDDQMGNHNFDEWDPSSTTYPKYTSMSPAWDKPSWYYKGDASFVAGWQVTGTSEFDYLHKDSVYAMAMAWWQVGTTAQLQTLFGNQNAEVAKIGCMLSLHNTNEALQFLITKGSAPNPVVINTANNSVDMDGFNYVIINHVGGNVASVYLNGTLHRTNTGSGSYSTSSVASQNFVIGTPSNQSFRDAFYGHLFEFMIVRGDTMIEADITSLESWFVSEYATSPYPAPSALDLNTPHHPDDIRGLLGWWSADSIPNQATGDTDGDTLSYWEDISGNGHPLTWSAGLDGDPPTYETAIAGFNSSDVVEFNHSDAAGDGNILSTENANKQFWGFTYGDTSATYISHHGHTAVIVFEVWEPFADHTPSTGWLMGTTYLSYGTHGGRGMRYTIVNTDSTRYNLLSTDNATWMIASKGPTGQGLEWDSTFVDFSAWEYNRANNDEWHKTFTTVRSDSFGDEPALAPTSSNGASFYPFTVGRSYTDNFGVLSSSIRISDILLYNHALTQDEEDYIKSYYDAKIFNIGTIGEPPGEPLGGGRGANIIRRRGVRRID